jgi:hypothetical protein
MWISPVFNADLLAFIVRSGETGVTKDEIKQANVSRDYSLDSDLATLISMREIRLDDDNKYRSYKYI